jgi:membrane associated rhomboid family serine protease
MNSIIRRPFKYRNDGVVFWLIGINILIFAIFALFRGNFAMFLYERMPTVTLAIIKFLSFLYNRMPMIPLAVTQQGWVWTFVTYMFMHGSITHILFNMFGLFIFGVQVERQLGSREFLLYYFVTGTLAGVLSFAVYYFTGNYIVALMGASGAIFAVELAYAVLFPNAIIYIWGIIPLRAPVMVLGFTALELFFSITGGRGNVAHLTHLAGFGFGWLYFVIRFGVSPWRRLMGR